MSRATSAAVDVLDWTVDTVRMAIRLPPLPPAALKLAFDSPLTVRVPTALKIELRRTARAFLRVEQGELILFEGPVPRDGRVGVMPMTPAVIKVLLQLESRNPAAHDGSTITEWIFEPLPNGPPVERFDVPATVSFGESIACAWDAPRAERVRLAVIESGNVSDHIGPATGQVLLPSPERPGRLLLRLTAEADWGQTTKMRAIDVAVPEVSLTLLRTPIQYGHPGERLTFEWKVLGADGVYLIEPDGDEPRLLEDKEGGFLFVTLGLQPAEFQIIARGYGGAEHSAVLRAVPLPFACLETDHE